MQSNFPFLCFFFKGSFLDVEFLYISNLFSALLAHFFHLWHFRCSFIFFSYVSPKLNKFFHLRYLAYMFCPSFYVLKKVFLLSFKVTIIHYSKVPEKRKKLIFLLPPHAVFRTPLPPTPHINFGIFKPRSKKI